MCESWVSAKRQHKKSSKSFELASEFRMIAQAEPAAARKKEIQQNFFDDFGQKSNNNNNGDEK